MILRKALIVLLTAFGLYAVPSTSFAWIITEADSNDPHFADAHAASQRLLDLISAFVQAIATAERNLAAIDFPSAQDFRDVSDQYAILAQQGQSRALTFAPQEEAFLRQVTASAQLPFPQTDLEVYRTYSDVVRSFAESLDTLVPLGFDPSRGNDLDARRQLDVVLGGISRMLWIGNLFALALQ